MNHCCFLNARCSEKHTNGEYIDTSVYEKMSYMLIKNDTIENPWKIRTHYKINIKLYSQQIIENAENMYKDKTWKKLHRDLYYIYT